MRSVKKVMSLGNMKLVHTTEDSAVRATELYVLGTD